VAVPLCKKRRLEVRSPCTPQRLDIDLRMRREIREAIEVLARRAEKASVVWEMSPDQSAHDSTRLIPRSRSTAGK
jgi:hypothetical protein